MALANFFIRSRDREPYLRGELRDAAGAVINLTGATVRFVMVDASNGSEAVNALATLVDAANGVVEYQWADGDTNTNGLYLARWVIALANGHALTVPNNGDMLIQIY